MFPGQSGPLSLCIMPPNAAKTLELLPLELARNLKQCASIVQAIYHLNGEAISTDVECDRFLRARLSRKLEDAAEQAPGDLARQLEARAEAVSNGDYGQAARTALDATGPWRLLLSEPFSAWTGTSAISMLLFHEDPEVNLSPRLEHAVLCVSEQDDLNPGSWTTRPAIVVGQKVLCAGQCASFPQEFATFLPEDESVNGNELTLFYSDFYWDRIVRISAPSLHYYSDGVIETPSDAVVRQAALDWFRSHDLSHFVYDEHVYKIEGLSRVQLHGIRELLADLTGLVATSAIHPPDTAIGYHGCYLAELIRYAGRDDGARSADGLSARLQLNALFRSFASWSDLQHALERNDFVPVLRSMRREIVDRVRVGNAARIEQFIEQYITMPSILKDVQSKDRRSVDDLLVDGWGRTSSLRGVESPRPLLHCARIR